MLECIIGGALSMECENGRQRLMVFLSKSLNKTKMNYKIHDKEMLAVIRELKSWRYLLKDTKFKFKVWTDHNNLQYFIKAQKLNQRQAHWALYLSRFNFTLKRMLDTKIKKVDELSRRLDQKVETKNNNNNQTLMDLQFN